MSTTTYWWRRFLSGTTTHQGFWGSVGRLCHSSKHQTDFVQISYRVCCCCVFLFETMHAFGSIYYLPLCTYYILFKLFSTMIYDMIKICLAVTAMKTSTINSKVGYLRYQGCKSKQNTKRSGISNVPAILLLWLQMNFFPSI